MPKVVLTIENLRKSTDDTLKIVFKAIDDAPGVAIIGEQKLSDPRKWSLLGDNRTKYAKVIKECVNFIKFKEDSYIPSKKDKLPLEKWNKLMQKITKMI